LCYYFGHLNIVYFAVPGKVEEIVLKPSSYSIIVEWKPGSYSDCVMEYIIEWVNNPVGSGQISVSFRVDSYTIQDLDACVTYEVSVTAVNEDNKGDVAENRTATTETAGNYQTHIIFLCL
jgi:hypothetical protein